MRNLRGAGGWFVGGASALLIITSVHAADPAAELNKTFRNLSVSVPKLAKAPTIDGTVDAEEWKDAGVAPRLVGFERDERLMDMLSRFYFAYTDDAFYMAWQMQRPKGFEAPKALITEPDKSFWRTDDAIEFMINCTDAGMRRTGGREYYLIWNALGTHYDRHEPVSAGESGAGMRWNGAWTAKSRTVEGFGWEGELHIPLSTLHIAKKPEAGDFWRYQIADNRATPSPLIGLAGYQINWFHAFDYPFWVFTGDQGVVVRVLESGAIAKEGKGGVVLELLNPGTSPRTVVPKLRFYQRKANAPSSIPYLRAFDQARDRDADIKGEGKIALFIADDKLSEQLITENYDVVKEQAEAVTLAAGERKTIDFTIPKKAGDYLVIYDVRYAEGQAPAGARELIAGAPLPFAIPEPLEIAFRPFYLVDKSLSVTADLRYVDGWSAAGAVNAKLVAASGGATVWERKIDATGKSESVTFDVPLAGVAPGKHQFVLSVADGSGKVVGSRTTDMDIPQTPEWYANKVGMSPTIPRPWKAIEVKGSATAPTVSFLMGEYDLADSVVPAALRVRSIYEDRRDPVLRGPATLTGVVDGQAVQWKGGVSVAEKREDAVRVTSTSTAGNVQVAATADFEFDGMARVTLDLTPVPGTGTTPNITEFTLSMPMTPKMSELVRINYGLLGPDKIKVNNGTLPAEGIECDWRSNVWLGDTRRGIEWFAENMKGWRVANVNATKVIDIDNSAEGATLKIHFILHEKGLVLDKPRQIVFGYQFTPPKTILQQAVRHGLGYYAPGKEHSEKLPLEIAAGVNAVEVWNHYELQGWPDQTPERSAELKAWADNLHKHGIKVTPYAGWMISRKAAVYPTFGSEMVVEPLIDAGCGCDTSCWNTPMSDAYLAVMRKAAKESGYDGFRMDAGFFVAPCSSLKHKGYGSECGWIDDYGNVQPSLQIFAAREAAKRAYRMYHSDDIVHDGLTLHHIHGGNRFVAIQTFQDAVVSAEGGERMALNMKEVDLSFWRAGVMEDRMGQQVIYGPKTDRLGKDSRLGVGLIHRLTVRGGSLVGQKEQSYSRDAMPTASIWKAEDWVQWLAPGTEFFGYWENKELLNTGNAEVFGSFHVRRGEKVLLALFNRELSPLETTVSIDLKALGFTGEVHGIDAVLHDAIAVKDGKLTVDFTAEGFRLIKIAAKPFSERHPNKSGQNLIPELSAATWPAGSAPVGWTRYEQQNIRVEGDHLVFASDGQKQVALSRQLILEPNKQYVFEAEVMPKCASGVYYGPTVERYNFHTVFGEFYSAATSIAGALLPGRYVTLRNYARTNEKGEAVARLSFTGNGEAWVKRLEIYEVDGPPPAEPWN